MTRIPAIAFAAAAALCAGMAAPALALDQASTPTTGSHIDPAARPQMLPPVEVGGATEAAKSLPLDANEARIDHPRIGEVDAAEWLPQDKPNQ